MIVDFLQKGDKQEGVFICVTKAEIYVIPITQTSPLLTAWVEYFFSKLVNKDKEEEDQAALLFLCIGSYYLYIAAATTTTTRGE